MSRAVALAVLGACLGLVSLPELHAHAGAWTRDEGSFFASLSYQRIGAGAFYGPDFSKIAIRPYSQQTVSAYAEAGVISRWLTLVFDGQLYRRNTLEGQGATDGLSDLRIGAWTGLVVAPVRLSLGLLVGLPTGDSRPRGPASDPDAQEIANVLPTGDGEVDVELRVSLGHAFGGGKSAWPLQHYLQVDAGYWLRTKGFADAFTWAIEAGTKFPWPFVDRFWIIAKMFGVESFADRESLAAVGFSGLGNGVTFTAFGLQVYGAVYGGFGLAVQVDGAFRARGVAAGANLRASLVFQR